MDGQLEVHAVGVVPSGPGGGFVGFHPGQQVLECEAGRQFDPIGPAVVGQMVVPEAQAVIRAEEGQTGWGCAHRLPEPLEGSGTDLFGMNSGVVGFGYLCNQRGVVARSRQPRATITRSSGGTALRLVTIQAAARTQGRATSRPSRGAAA